jgi:hypothetical protein
VEKTNILAEGFFRPSRFRPILIPMTNPKARFTLALSKAVRIDGEVISTLEEAAQAIRRYSLRYNDYVAWRLSHLLREADGPLRVRFAEARLHDWLRLRAL